MSTRQELRQKHRGSRHDSRELIYARVMHEAGTSYIQRLFRHVHSTSEQLQNGRAPTDSCTRAGDSQPHYVPSPDWLLPHMALHMQRPKLADLIVLPPKPCPNPRRGQKPNAGCTLRPRDSKSSRQTLQSSRGLPPSIVLCHCRISLFANIPI